jgi:hypothetical protein
LKFNRLVFLPIGVRDAMTLYECEGSERMNPGTFLAHNAVNSNSPYSQRIGDERTVATPWNRFRTHDCAPLLASQFNQSLQSGVEVRGLHIVSESTE